MGNCQAAEAATVVIQHPHGKIERLYWPTPANDVMKSNPGHHVALVTLCVAEVKPRTDNSNPSDSDTGRTVRFTRVRLLKPKDMLLIGKVYKLISTQEVTKALAQRKNEKLRKAQQQPLAATADKQEKPRQKQWRPALQSISESMS